MNNDEKKKITNILKDLERAYWFLHYSVNKRLPTKISQGMRVQSYVEDDDIDMDTLSMVKEDWIAFLQYNTIDAYHLVKDASTEIGELIDDLEDYYDIWDEVKQEVDTRYDEYLRSWWPKKLAEKEAKKND